MESRKEIAGLNVKKSELEGRIPEYDNMLSMMNSIFENQEILVDLESKASLKGYGYSETHCIDIVGSTENPNVTLISNQLKMTRGAISKTMKKLLSKGLVESYRLQGNRKEIYFRLTEKGKELYDAHKERHRVWLERDYGFLKSLDQELFQSASEFTAKYCSFLQYKIESLEKSSKS